jgi:hypothetical protein
MNGYEVCHSQRNGLVTVDTCFWLLDVDQDGTVSDSTDGLWIYNVMKYHLTYDFVLNQKPVIPEDLPGRAFLASDAEIIAYVQGLISCAASLTSPPGIDMDIDNDGKIIASRDGVYIYRWLRYHGSDTTAPAGHGMTPAQEAQISSDVNTLETTRICPNELWPIPCPGY